MMSYSLKLSFLFSLYLIASTFCLPSEEFNVYRSVCPNSIISTLYSIEGYVDIWNVSPLSSTTSEIISRLDGLAHMELKNICFDVEVYLSAEELDRAVKEEFWSNRIRLAEHPFNPATDDFFANFRTYDEIMAYCESLLSTYSSIMTSFVAGTTYEGRTIYGYKISTNEGTKPAIYLEALQHAREWLATPTLLYTMQSLLEGYAQGNQTVAKYVEELDWYIVPVVNVDGYLFTWSNDTINSRYWRKNRHEFSPVTYGVDLNRNWGPADTWCTEGSSTNKQSETYCGEFVFSEPETQSMSSLMQTIPNLAAAIDFHCYGALLLWPWQYSYNHIPHANYTHYSTTGQSMVDAIYSVNGINFVSEQGSDLYPHSGGLIDWTYSEWVNTLAFTLELRGEDFVVPATYITPSGKEAFQGVLVLASEVLSST